MDVQSLQEKQDYEYQRSDNSEDCPDRIPILPSSFKLIASNPKGICIHLLDTQRLQFIVKRNIDPQCWQLHRQKIQRRGDEQQYLLDTR